jgi:hypothetical protein
MKRGVRVEGRERDVRGILFIQPSQNLEATGKIKHLVKKDSTNISIKQSPQMLLFCRTMLRN